jgi:predicted DNA-binding protein with PD1-like motif
MKYTVGSTGRVVTARLENNEAIYPAIESIAQQENIACAVVWIIGGMQNGSVVVGPKDPAAMPFETMVTTFIDAHEILGIGTLFLNSENKPVLHMHAGMGRGASPVIGCPRKGADCWLVDEVIILELTGIAARRIKQADTGLELLEIE